MTHSLDAYLEPTRLSFSSPPISELTQPGSDESYPVFSPLHQSRKESFQSNVVCGGEMNNVNPATTQATATGTMTTTTTMTVTALATTNAIATGATSTSGTNNTLQPVSFVRQHRRQSSVNTVSWTDQGEAATVGRVRRLSTQLIPSNVS